MKAYLRLILRKIASALREQWDLRLVRQQIAFGKTTEAPLRVANTTYYDYSVGRLGEYSWRPVARRFLQPASRS
jgi:hypothetical protein